MRVFPNFIKTTLKEDQDFYRALVEAAEAGPSSDQVKVLSLVKFHHLDHNRDLTTDLYNSFLVVLDELGVHKPIAKINEYDQEAGSWYVIPGVAKNHKGQSQAERLARRSASRKAKWQQVVEASQFTVGALDLLLTEPTTVLGEIRDTMIAEINSLELKCERQVDQLKTDLAKMVSRMNEIEKNQQAVYAMLDDVADRFEAME